VPVPLGIDDSFNGYLYRIAEYYEYPSPWPLLACTGTPKYVRSVRAPLDRLASMLKVPVGALERRTYWRQSNGTRRFFDQLVGDRHLIIWECRVCPECLRQKLPHSAIFDIAVNTVCDRHRVALVSQCPKCEKRLGWKRRRLERCACGYDLRQVAAEVADSGSLRLAWLFRRAAKLEDASCSFDMGSWPEDLLKVELRTLCGLITFLLYRDEAEPLRPHVALTLDILRPRIERTLQSFFAKWPSGGIAFFDRVRAGRITAVPPETSPYRRRYSVTRGEMSRMIPGGIPAFLEEARNLHLSTVLSSRHPSPAANQARWISREEAAQRLRASPYRVDRLCQIGLLQSNEYKAGLRRFVVISAESVITYRDLQANALSKYQVNDMYGLPHKSLLRLVDAGRVRALPHGIGYRRACERYDRSSVELLLSRLNARALIVPSRSPGNSFTSLIAGASYARAVEAAAAGELPLYRRTAAPAKRFDELLLAATDVKEARRSELINSQGLGMWDSAKWLGFHPEYLKRLVARGMFRLLRKPVRRKRGTNPRSLRFTLEQLCRFQNEFVRLRDIARFNGVSANRVADALGKRAAHPVRAPRPNGTRQARIYRRREVVSKLEAYGWHLPPVRSL
jgi:hypothetical protein